MGILKALESQSLLRGPIVHAIFEQSKRRGRLGVRDRLHDSLKFLREVDDLLRQLDFFVELLCQVGINVQHFRAQ